MDIRHILQYYREMLGRRFTVSSVAFRRFSRHYEFHKKTPLQFNSEEEVNNYVFRLFKGYFRTLNQSLMTMRSHYRELGLDDLDKLEITLSLEGDLGMEVPQSVFEKISTLQSVSNFILTTPNYRS